MAAFGLALILVYQIGQAFAGTREQKQSTDVQPVAFIPLVSKEGIWPAVYIPAIANDPPPTPTPTPTPTPPPTCPTTSGAGYATMAYQSGPYKGNRLTDQNADFRLSILGYTPANELLTLVHYGGATDPDAPKFWGMFSPHRLPTFTTTYHVYYWIWVEGAGALPPYGYRGGVNVEWPVTVLDVATVPREAINIPQRSASISGNYKAMVLYASERELTIVYMWQDQVVWDGHGYVVHMLNFCTDPNLVATYRAQLRNGYRYTGRLPVLGNAQPVGSALSISMTVAIRDGGAYMDPRSDKDWWAGLP